MSDSNILKASLFLWYIWMKTVSSQFHLWPWLLGESNVLEALSLLTIELVYNIVISKNVLGTSFIVACPLFLHFGTVSMLSSVVQAF